MDIQQDSDNRQEIKDLHGRIPWYGYVVLVLFFWGCFQAVEFLWGGVMYSYMNHECQSFDYNDHPKWQWHWWGVQCSAIMQ